MIKKKLPVLFLAAVLTSNILCSCGKSNSVTGNKSEAANSGGTEYTSEASEISVTGTETEREKVFGDLTIRMKTPAASLLTSTAEAMRDGTDFNDISYERYDDTHMKELIEDIRSKMDDAANADEVLDLFTQVQQCQLDSWVPYEIAQLHNSMDAGNDYYAEEMDFCTNQINEDDDLVNSLGKDILSSSCGDAARAIWDSNDIAGYENYVEMTDEQLNLYDREQDILSEYYEAAARDFTVTIRGQEYDLYDLYSDSSLSDLEYDKYFTELTKKENDVLGPIFVDLVKVRKSIAKSYGYDNYADYAYAMIYDRDYTPKQSLQLCEYVKNYLTESYNCIYNESDDDKTYTLNDAFSNMAIQDQMSLFEGYLPEISNDLLTSFRYMEKYHLYDLEYAETKQDTGYTIWLTNYNEPFLYNQPEGDFYDFMSLIHEFGHFNAFYQNPDTADYANCVDVAEIHSQGLEMLYTLLYPEMFGEEYGRTATTYSLIQKANAVLDGCMYDEFQQQVYESDDLSPDEINRIFASVASEYGYSYSGDEAYEWVEISHNFVEPFYYISYAVSALPALEIWEKAQNDKDTAIALYLDLVNAGETGTYLETLEDCGLSNPFHEDTIKTIAQTLWDYTMQ